VRTGQGAVASGVGHDGGVTQTEPVRAREPKAVGDLLRSLALVVALAAVVVLITFRPQGQSVTPVDYRATLAAAQVGAPFRLLEPVGLPTAWTASSAYYDPPASNLGVASWHIGYVTAEGAYAGFEQTDGVTAGVLRDVLGDPTDLGQTVHVAGTTWQRWASADGDRRALVQTGTGASVVVDGSAGWTELERLAGSLRPGT
jgi:Protein of unknown function (DUF4245)